MLCATHTRNQGWAPGKTEVNELALMPCNLVLIIERGHHGDPRREFRHAISEIVFGGPNVPPSAKIRFIILEIAAFLQPPRQIVKPPSLSRVQVWVLYFGRSERTA